MNVIKQKKMELGKEPLPDYCKKARHALLKITNNYANKLALKSSTAFKKSYIIRNVFRGSYIIWNVFGESYITRNVF